MDDERDGVTRIADERQRQRGAEGYTDAHDDEEHDDGGLAEAAGCYAFAAASTRVYRQERFAASVRFRDPWPWEQRYDARPYDGNVLRDASGYFGHDSQEVSVYEFDAAGEHVMEPERKLSWAAVTFRGDDARALSLCGKKGRFERNDSQEPALALEDLTDRELAQAGLNPVRVHQDYDPRDEHPLDDLDQDEDDPC